MIHLTLDVLLVLTVLVSLALLWRKPTVITQYRERVVPAQPVAAQEHTPSMRVRLLGDFGDVGEEILVTPKGRGPVLTHHGVRYGAERLGADGVWIYRRLRQ